MKTCLNDSLDLRGRFDLKGGMGFFEDLDVNEFEDAFDLRDSKGKQLEERQKR